MSEAKGGGKPRVRARFVVQRATKWAESDCVRYLLKPLQPDWDPKDNEDPVEQLLYEVKDSQIPRDFEFVHTVTDSKSALFGEGGIEIEVFEAEHQLELGEIIDIWFILIGRVEFQ